MYNGSSPSLRKTHEDLETAPWVKVFATKPDDPEFIPREHMRGRATSAVIR